MKTRIAGSAFEDVRLTFHALTQEESDVASQSATFRGRCGALFSSCPSDKITRSCEAAGILLAFSVQTRRLFGL